MEGTCLPSVIELVIRVVKELNDETGEYEEKIYVDIIRYRRITGYLTYTTQFNHAKAAELKDRVKHS